VTSAHEIETAIRTLSPVEREKLVKDLPSLLPELDGDAAWDRITRDSKARTKLTAILDQVQDDYRKNPSTFPEIKEKDFDLES
jgi:hypothetical protein